MSIGKICNRAVVLTDRNATVREAARLMRQHHVGDLVVVAGDGERTPVGIVTDRDIVMEVVAQDLQPEDLTVGEIMSQDLICANERDGVFETIQLMRTKGVRRIPITDSERTLIGIISIDDLLELLAEEMTTLSKVMPRERAHEARVRP